MLTRHQHYLATLTVAGIAIAVWFLVPNPAPIRPTQALNVPWKIQVPTRSNSTQLMAALSSANLWGKLADFSQPSEIEPEWRFIGAMSRGRESHVIIKKDNLTEQVLVVGDSLPGGSKILSIDGDRLCLLINGQKRSLFIYSQGPLSGKMSQFPEGPSTQLHKPLR